MKSSLNHIYRTIWSEALNAWVAVSEITSAKGKRSGSSVLNAALSAVGAGHARDQKIRGHGSLLLKPLVIALAYCFSLNAQANPIGAQVVNGTAAINQSGNTLNITNSPNAIINWQGFSINTGETTRFIQQTANSSVLNRVIGPDPSQLLGTLTSNGRVFLINPAGIMVGQGARIDVPGFVASTLNLSNSNFLAGKLNFDLTPNAGAIQNNGSITTPEGGTVYLVAPQIENHGIITTPRGETILAAGNTVQLVDTATPGVTVQVTGSGNNATNLGQILADSGRIGMVGAVVKNSGTVSANSLVSEGGRILLKATNRVEAGGTISAQGVGGGEIKVLADMQRGTVNVTGTLDASSIAPSPSIPLPVGEGSQTLPSPSASLPSPTGGGAGGGGANGGQIETSAAHVNIADTARVTTASSMGLAGTWLIDPFDFTIAATGGNMTGATLTANLAGGNIIIASTTGTTGTLGDVNVNDVVTWSLNKLTLNAQNNINLNANLNGSGTASLALEYGQVSAGGGTSTYNVNAAVNLPAGNNFSTKLGSTGVVKNYTVINSLGAAGSVTAADLQGMNSGLALNYALGSNIDAAATSAWNAGAGFAPVGNATTQFTGVFDGLGHTISNLTINRPTTNNVGLFGHAGNGSALQNVGLVGGSINATGFVGPLVGYNLGQVTNSYVSGATVNNTTGTGSVGGLVGFNESGGSVSTSYASASISGNWNVGGLVGGNRGTLTNSYATGNVTGTAATSGVGGLVGTNYTGTGVILNSYASGVVSGSGVLAGLIASNLGTVTNSYWNTTTSGRATSSGGTGLTTTQMQTAANFTGFTFTTTPGATGNNWVMVDANGTLNNAGGAAGATFPMLASEYSTTINNAHQLQLMQMAPAASYTLGSNIDASKTANSTDVWGSAGFVPVGNLATFFTGTFNGMGYTISNLTINRPTINTVGLFGYVGTGSTIRNVGLTGGSVSGSSYVGGLVGVNAGTVSNSYATDSVSGIGNYVGGLVGDNNYGTVSSSYATGNVNGTGFGVGGLVGLNGGGSTFISNSYATGSVTGVNQVGGLVGNNGGTVTNSYAIGSVSGTTDVGGLVGFNYGTTTNSFWNTTNNSGFNPVTGGFGSGSTVTTGATGMTTTQMMQISSFSNWNTATPNTIANTGGSGATWRIYEGHTAPLLTSFLTPLTLTGAPDATVTYNGAAQSGAAFTLITNVLGAAATGTNAGFYNGYYSTQQGYDLSGGNLTIAQLASVAWTGASGNWSNAANWAGSAIPTGANVAAVTIPSGVTVTYDSGVSGTTTLNTLTSSGTLAMAAGTLALNGASSLSALNMSGGTLGGTGAITIPTGGTFTWSNGVISGSGTLTTQSGVTTLLAPGFAQTAALRGSRVWDNFGTVTFTPNAGTLSYFQIDDTITDGTAVFNNNSGAIFNINASFNDTHIIGAGTFNNAGTLNKNLNGSAAASGFTPAFNNQSGGVVNVNSGTLRFDTGGADAGNYVLANSSTLQFNGGPRTITGNIGGAGNVTFSKPLTANAVYTVSGDYNISGTTTADLNDLATGTLTFDGTVTNLGTGYSQSGGVANVSFAGITGGGATGFQNLGAITVNNGSLTFANGTNLAGVASLTRAGGGTLDLANNNLSLSTLTVSGGTLTGSGNVSVSGAFGWTNGAISGSGTLTTQGTTTLMPGFAQTASLRGSRVWDNFGTVTFTPNAGTLSYFQIDDTTADGTAIFNNKAGGQFNINASFNDTHTIGVGTFNNAGTLNKNLNGSAASSSFAPAFNNQATGVVNVNSSTLNVIGALTQSGTINTSAGATFTDTLGFTNTATGILTGKGTISVGAAALTNNGTINPGADGIPGTLTISGDLVMGVGGKLNADLMAAAGGYDVLAVTGVSTLANGTLVLKGVGGAGSYPVLTSAGGFGATPTAFGAITSGTFTQTPVYAANSLTLNVTANSNPVVGGVYWTGTAADNNWATAANWSNTLTPTSVSNLYIGAGAGTVSVSSAAQAANNLYSDASLTLATGGALTLTTASTITGTLLMNGGTLTANAGLTANDYTHTAGTLNIGGTTLLQSPVNMIVNGAIASNAGGTLTLQAANNILLGAGSSITGTVLPLNVILNSSSAGTGGAISAAGAINAGTGAVKLVAGTGGIGNNLGSGLITANTLEVISGGNVVLAGYNLVNTLAASVTGAGALTFENAAASGLTVGMAGATTGVAAPGNISIYQYASGGITANSNVTSAAGSVLLGIASGAGTATVANTSTVSGNGVQVYTSGGAITLNGNLTGNSGSGVTVGGIGSGAITGTGIINTTGLLTTSSAGGTTLNGANTVGGFNATNITGGAITLTNSAAALNIAGISQAGGGAVNVTSTGNITTSGPIAADGNINLFATGGAADDVTISNGINYTNTLIAGALEIRANRNVTVQTSPIQAMGAQALNVIINADRNADNSGSAAILSGGNILSNGGNITLGGGANPLTTAAVGAGTATSVEATGIYLSGVTLGAGAGNISLRGIGAAGTSFGADGIYVTGGSIIQASGAGAITLNGTGGNGTSSNSGVRLGTSAQVLSANGNISVTGMGAGAGASNYGVYIHNGAVVSATGTGSILLDGTGAVTGTKSNYGVRISASGGATRVTSASGNISVAGHGGADGDGIQIVSGALVQSGTGGITLSGTSGTGTTLNWGDWGVYLSGAGTTVTSGGNINITGTSTNLNAGTSVNRGVYITSGAHVVANGVGAITMAGNGGYDGDGIYMGTSAVIQANTGEISLTGISGTGPSTERGIYIGGSGALIQSAGDITLTGTSMATTDASNHGIYLSWGSINSTGGNLTLTGASQAGATNYGINIWDAINSAGTTTLNSDRNILVQTSQAPTGNMVLRADEDGTGVGTVTFLPGITITNLAGKRTDLYYNPVSYTDAATKSDTSGNPYSANLLGAGTNTAWMLMNDATQLQAMNTNLVGTYALGKNIDAAATATWNSGAGFMPVASFAGLFDPNIYLANGYAPWSAFVGQFDGLGHAISNLTINRPSEWNTGLFGVLGTGSVVSNVGLVGGSVTGGAWVTGGLAGNNVGGVINNVYNTSSVSGANNVGGLVGFSVNGTISNAYNTGAVSGSGGTHGGLVGASNNSAISNSYNTGAVSNSFGTIGGLVGLNNPGSTILRSYSTGNVSSTTSGIGNGVGGLVGYNRGSVSDSYATGNASSADYVGGLVGINYTDGTISTSYATGSVSGTTNVGGLVGNNGGAVSNSFWDTATSGQPTVGVGSNTGALTNVVGMNTAQMMAQANFTSATAANGNVNPAWDFTNTWWMSDTNTRPFLRMEHSNTITNAHQMQLMAMNLSANYKLGANINMAEVTASASGMWDTTKGFVPVGDLTTNFTGQFDGLGHTISNLTINRPATNYVGLFGFAAAGSEIKNVGLLGGSVKGGSYEGGLVGSNSGAVSNAYSTGSVSGIYFAGGLVGVNGGTISNSYATGAAGDVSSISRIGGLVGGNGGTVSNSYATGNVMGGTADSNSIGGLVGKNYGSVANSYATGSVSGILTAVGGLVGENRGSISNSYATGSVSGTVSQIGGLVGAGGYGGVSGTISNSFWDTTVNSGLADNGLGVGISTAGMMNQTTLTGLGFDLTNWWMSDTNTRPFLRMEHSTTITNAHQLQLMAMDFGAHYTLGANISMAELASPSGMWDTAKSFVPVGDNSTNTTASQFTGQFDGLNHTISNLTINRPTTNNAGLFGYAGTGSAIRNVGLIDGSVIGANYVGGLVGAGRGMVDTSYSTGSVGGVGNVGGLVGWNYGAVSNSFATGNVRGTGNEIGGLVGLNYGAVSNAYATGKVNGYSDVGGLVGFNGNTINKAYSTGVVNGTYNVGGLVGWNEMGPSYVTNSFWNTDTSGLSYSAGGFGRITASMMTGTNFTSAGWDTNTWGIVEGISYPYLKWRFPTAPQIVSGTLGGWGNSGQTIKTVQGGNLLMTTSTGANGFYYQALDAGSVASGHALLAYLTCDCVGTAAVRLSDGNNLTGVDLTSNTLTVSSNNSAPVSNAILAAAKGGNTSIIVPYSVTGTSLTANWGVAFQTAPNTNYSLDGNVITSGAGQIWNGPVTIVAKAILQAGGNIALDGAISGNNLTLDSTGTVTQGAAINVAGLELLGAGGIYTLTNTGNAITTVAGNTGSVSLSNSTALTVGTVNTTVGLTTRGNVALHSATDINVNALIKTGLQGVGVTVGSAGDVSLTAGGNILLGVAGTAIDASVGANGVGTTTGRGGDISLTAAGGILGAASSIWANVIKFQSGSTGNRAGNITLTANGGNVTIGDIFAYAYQDDTGGAIGNGGNIAVTASGSITVGAVDTSATGAINNLGGITTIGNGGNISLIAKAGDVTVNGLVDASPFDGGFATSVGQGGNIVLHAGANGACLSTGRVCSTVIFGGAGSVATTGAGRVDLYYDPVSYTDATTRSDAFGDPYSANITGAYTAWMLVNDATQLQSMNTNLTGAYALGKNIDAAATATWNAGAGFVPVGTFSGQFDGLGNTINNLTIKRPAENNVALFSAVAAGGVVRNVGLVGGGVTGNNTVAGIAASNSGAVSYAYSNLSVNGFNTVAGIVGANIGGTVDHSYNLGTIAGTGTHAGGVVADSFSGASITNSYNSGSVSGNYIVGGVVGKMLGGTASNSYNIGYVSGTLNGTGQNGQNIGGFVGANDAGTINNSYSIGPVSGTSQVGGFAGATNNYAAINNSYSTGAVTGTTAVGGFIGKDYIGGAFSNNFWDTQTSNQPTVGVGVGVATGVSGMTTADMMTGLNFTSATVANGSVNPAWDFTNTWYMLEGNTRPFLRMEHSTTITNAHQLQLMAMDLSANYTLANNVDLAPALDNTVKTGMWGNAGFVPVGDGSWNGGGYINFTGTFDGANHTISNLTINRPSGNNIGLFGTLGAGGTVSQVSLTGANVSGLGNVGTLVGNNGGTVSNSSVTGVVSGVGNGNYIGGMIGYNSGLVADSSANVIVSSTGWYTGGMVGENGSSGVITGSHANGDVTNTASYVGGLVGKNYGLIEKSYATGIVIGDGSFVGGLVGRNKSSGVIRYSYATGNVSGSSAYEVGGLVGENDGGVIGYSYAAGNVSGPSNAGGLVGDADGGSISSSYATGNVIGNGSIGGLVGYNHWGASITNSYATGHVSGSGISGGLVGNYVSGTLTNNYWDTTTSGAFVGLGSGTTTGVTGMATADMMAQANFTSATAANGNVNPNWDLTNTWWMSDTNTRPFLRMEHSTTIANAHQLQLMAMDLTVNYTLANNIDLAPALALGGMWSNAGFVPVGDGLTFAGQFDGQNHTISNLTINRPANNNVGLFDSSSGVVKNVGLIGGSVTGSWNVGGLVGYNTGSISNSYVSGGTVTGSEAVGGLVGHNMSGSISQSYVIGGMIIGDWRVGGLVGRSDGNAGDTGGTGYSFAAASPGVAGISAVISESYVSGSTVSGVGDVGGLVGRNQGGRGGFGGLGYSAVGGVGGAGGAANISNSYVSGVTVTATSTNVGGLVGANIGGDGGGGEYGYGNYWGGGVGIGGAGGAGGAASISNNYVSGGTVSGTSTNIGGMVGSNAIGAGGLPYPYSNGSEGLGGTGGAGNISSSFWNTALKGGNLTNGIGNDAANGSLPGDIGAVGLTLAQMTTMSSFTNAGWSIANTAGSGAVWRIYEGSTTPLLRSFLTPLTVTADNVTKSYNGSIVTSLTNTSYSVAGADSSGHIPNITNPYNGAVNVGSYATGLYSDQQGYDISYVNGTLTINPGVVSLSGTRAYDGTVNVAAGIYTLSGLASGENLTLTGVGTISNKNVGTYNVTLGSLTLGNGANGLASNYTFTGGTLTANIIAASITVTGITASNKVYDGATAATLNTAAAGFAGMVAGENLSFTGAVGVFSDRNVATGKTVTISGITLGGADAGNYVLSGNSATAIADITVRPLSTWSGRGGNTLWSNAANWDALPDGSNVLAVSIPTGGSVTFDGAVALQALTSAGSMAMNGNNLSLGSFIQTGGSLTGTGNLNVTNNFSQTGGTITLTGAAIANITQATGNLNIANLSVPTASLTAKTGAITQTGPIIVAALTTQSVTGTTLTDTENRIGSFSASNSGSGKIMLTNSGVLTIAGIDNSNDDIEVDNTGETSTDNHKVRAGKKVSINAHSPLTIGSGGIEAGGNISLTAGATTGAGDNLTISGLVNSTGSGALIALFAGDNLMQNANVSSNGGGVTATALTGNIAMALGVSTSTGGGALGYSAPAGNIILASLNAGSGAINLDAHGNVSKVSGSTAPSLIGGLATLNIGGNANFSTQVQKLDANVNGSFTIKDTSGYTYSDAPAVPDVAHDVVQQLVTTVTTTTNKIGATTTSDQSGNLSIATNVAPLPAAGSAGVNLLGAFNSAGSGNIGGTIGTFGGGDISPPAAASGGASSPASGALTAPAVQDGQDGQDNKDRYKAGSGGNGDAGQKSDTAKKDDDAKKNDAKKEDAAKKDEGNGKDDKDKGKQNAKPEKC